VHAGPADHGGRNPPDSRRTPGFRSTMCPRVVVWARGGAHGDRGPRVRDGLSGGGANGGGAVPPPAGCSRSGRIAASMALLEPPCCDVATCFVAAGEKPIQTDRFRPRRTRVSKNRSRMSCGFRWMARR